MKKFALMLLLLTPSFMKAQPHDPLEYARREDKYLFIFLTKGDPASREMERIFDRAVRQVETKAHAVKIDTQDPSQKPFLQKLNLTSAPVPFVFVVAPNGAVMGGFAMPFTENQLIGVFGSQAMEKTLWALQNKKLVFILIQNEKTQGNRLALQGVEEFKTDPKYQAATEIVYLNPADPQEKKFLNQLQVDPDMKKAVTIFLAPPGDQIGKFLGATNKQEIIKALKSAVSGCCGPGGCPGGRCGNAN